MKKFIEVFKRGSKTFYFAGLFLPKRYRSKVAKLYYYCRLPDDICDTQTLDYNDKLAKIDTYLKNEDLNNFLDENKIPKYLYKDLIDGIKSDLIFKQPNTLNDLLDYSYKVAGTVGIMMSHIFDVKDEIAYTHAKNLGIAMQITNILRDIEEDLDNNRIYLPTELLNKHNITIEQIKNKSFDNNLRNLIIELIEVAKVHYLDGNDGIKYLPNEVQNSIRIASKLYAEILLKIEKNNYNPFKGRVYLNLFEKVAKIIYA